MTETEVHEFVARFASAWAARDGEAFLSLWHAEGWLYYPLVDRPIHGSELGRLNDIQRERAPDLVWQLLDWAWRGNTLFIEWQSTRVFDGQRFDWRGADKIRLQEGKILEERVYMDTALIRALRGQADRSRVAAAAARGVAFEPLFVF